MESRPAGAGAERSERQGCAKRNGALDAEVRDLKQGFEAIEERARYELGLIKQDEIFLSSRCPRAAPEIGLSPKDGGR